MIDFRKVKSFAFNLFFLHHKFVTNIIYLWIQISVNKFDIFLYLNHMIQLQPLLFKYRVIHYLSINILYITMLVKIIKIYFQWYLKHLRILIYWLRLSLIWLRFLIFLWHFFIYLYKWRVLLNVNVLCHVQIIYNLFNCFFAAHITYILFFVQ